MKHLVEIPLEEGGYIIVEVDEPEVEGTILASRGDSIIKVKETFEDALNKVLPVTKSVITKLRNFDKDNKPDEIEVKFGINLSTVVGAVIASASVSANFEVTLRWAENKHEEAP